MTLWMTELPPFIPFYLAAVAALVTRGWLRSVIMLAVPVASAIQLFGMSEGSFLAINMLDFELQAYRVDRLSLLFGYLFHLAAFIGIIYSLHVKDTTQQVAAY